MIFTQKIESVTKMNINDYIIGNRKTPVFSYFPYTDDAKKTRCCALDICESANMLLAILVTQPATSPFDIWSRPIDIIKAVSFYYSMQYPLTAYPEKNVKDAQWHFFEIIESNPQGASQTSYRLIEALVSYPVLDEETTAKHSRKKPPAPEAVVSVGKKLSVADTPFDLGFFFN